MSTHLRYLDKYELRELLGRGGMAEVWKAYDTQLQRYVAIKLLHTDLQSDPDFLNRFVREARVIASLRHPNIVQVYDFKTTTSFETVKPIAYMVMEYIDGPTLAEYIRYKSRQGHFPSGEDLVHIFAALSRAIDYAHGRGMIHRDIKPANILLDKRNTTSLPDGEPVLTDFGIARLMGASTGTLSHTWIGTPLYLSPEQAQGQPGSELSDIYSLGIILYEICTGTQPFRGESIPAIILQQISTNPMSPETLNPQVTPMLAGVIKCCLAKNPAERFRSASSLTVALARALNQPVPTEIQQARIAPFNQNDYSGTDSLSSPTAPSAWQQPPSSPPQSINAKSDSTPIGAHFPVPLFSEQSPPGAQAASPAFPSSGTGSPPNAMMPPTPNFMSGSPMSNAGAGLPPPTPVMPVAPQSVTPAPSEPITPQPDIAAPSETPASASRKRLSDTPPGRVFPRLLNLFEKKPPWLFPALMVTLVLLVLGSGAGGIYWLAHRSSAGMGGQETVGHVFFTNSGQINENNDRGLNDNIVVDLQNIQNPASGKAYYAWLLSDLDNSDMTSIALNRVNVNNGSIHFQYSAPDHSNLLAVASRFLITEEDPNNPPGAPTLDHSAWRYYAVLPHMPDPQSPEHYSLLDHLHHLLARDPKLHAHQLEGGLGIWFFRNTEKVLEWSGSARDSWAQQEASGVRRQVIRVLDYLDGSQFVQLDVPTGTPLLVNPRIARVALLEIDQTKQAPPGYVSHIHVHLNGIVNSPGVSPDQRRLATQIGLDLNRVAGWLNQVRQDARQLVNMSDQDLLSNNALNILNDMETHARYAYVGKLDPTTNQIQNGVTQIYYQSQALTTMNVIPYNGG